MPAETNDLPPAVIRALGAHFLATTLHHLLAA